MVMLHRFITFLFVPITAYVFFLVCGAQPDPYMDEEFHFPQAVKYFHGKFFEWDSKITTPPGLYIISNGLLQPLAKITGLDVCHITFFRTTNVFFMLGNLFLFVKVLQKVHHKDIPEDAILMSAVNLSVFPLLYFFTFLYYTDCGSVFFLLLMYLLHLNQHQWIASAFGMMAVLFRQTNIIWMFFVAAHPVLQVLLSKSQRQKGAHPSTQKVKSARSNNYMKKMRVKLTHQLQYWVPVISDIIFVNVGYLVTAVFFVSFVVVNKSVALGDKDAHESVFNIPQGLYFLLFSMFFSCPFFITLSMLKTFFSILRRRTFVIILAIAGVALSIRYLTYQHPYLLADNRHFSFYLWKRVLNRNIYLTHSLIPACIYSGWAMSHQLRHKELLWRLLFFVCVLFSLVPHKLLEMRYFIVPFIFFRLHIKLKSLTQIYFEFFLSVFVNAIAIYLFLERPFIWDHEKTLQRFMW